MNDVTVCSRSLEHKLQSLKVPGYQERAFIFLLYTFESYLCILDRRPLSDMCSANIFCALSFHSLIVPFKELKYLILTKSTLFGFPTACALGVIPKIIFVQGDLSRDDRDRRLCDKYHYAVSLGNDTFFSGISPFFLALLQDGKM